jgi:hypothetical protein
VGEEQTERSAEYGQNNTFGEKLANEPCAGGACREAHAHLSLPGRRAGKQQSRHVGTSDQKYEANTCHEDEQGFRKPLAQELETFASRDNLNVGQILRSRYVV